MRHLFLSVLLLVAISSWAQLPFQDEIDAFKKKDRIHFPGKNKILFVGSSSFRLWKDLQSDFPERRIINRAFGGSAFRDLLAFKNDIILPYSPKQVFIYCGENDLANDVEPDVVFNQFTEFFTFIRESHPKASIAFVSIKPSPVRAKILEEVKVTNDRIRTYISMQKNAVFIDVFSLMLGTNGKPREELFVEDRLHMNRTGYDIWKKAIGPHLK